MPTLIETFDPSLILQPVQEPQDARQDAVAFGPSLTIARGQALGIKTADQKAYAFATGAGDGTQKFVGFSMYSLITDAAGLVYRVTSPQVAAANLRLGPSQTSPLWRSGIFDPQDLQTAAVPAGAIITVTPTGTPTVGDVWTTTITFNDLSTRVLTFTVGAAPTATTVSGQYRTMWNADPVAPTLAAASGSATVLLTAANLGNTINVTAGAPLSIVSAITGVGTLTQTNTTAASGRAIADIQTSLPGARVLHNGFWLIPG